MNSELARIFSAVAVLGLTACAPAADAGPRPTTAPRPTKCIGMKIGDGVDMAEQRLHDADPNMKEDSVIGLYQSWGPYGTSTKYTTLRQKDKWDLRGPNPDTSRPTTILCTGDELPQTAAGYGSATSIALDQAAIPPVAPICDSVFPGETTATALRRIIKLVEKNPLYDAAYFTDKDGVMLWDINWQGNIFAAPKKLKLKDKVCADNMDDFSRRPPKSKSHLGGYGYGE